MEWNTKWEWENLNGFCFNLSGGSSDGGGGGGGSGEPFIGLKLGKRTYFENNYSKDTNKTSSVLGVPVSSTGKKVKMSRQGQSQSQSTPISRCQVEGCNLDLSSAKEYHRKHRVCETHSKSPKVIVAGLERRFCQQCSRFHSMSEFDEEKRSCRRRLSDHNARRRKPQQDLTRFNSPSQYSSSYGNEYVDMLSHSSGVQLSDVLNMSKLARNGLVGLKGARTEIVDQGFKESLSSNVEAVKLRRALSLLSNNSWGSCESNSIAIDHPMISTSPTMVQNVVSHGSPHQYWEANQQWFDPSIHTKTSTNNNNLQEFEVFKPPYENSFLFHPSS